MKGSIEFAFLNRMKMCALFDIRKQTFTSLPGGRHDILCIIPKHHLAIGLTIGKERFMEVHEQFILTGITPLAL